MIPHVMSYPFPAKLMQMLGIRRYPPHIRQHSCTNLFAEVIVVTDSELFLTRNSHGGRAVKSLRTHESGSDRIAEAVEKMDVDM